MTKNFFILLAFAGAGLFTCGAFAANAKEDVKKEDDKDKSLAQFEKPIQLMAAGEAIRTEEPGYASPGWADMDGDGKKDLLVGQFADGKIKVYKNLGNAQFAAGEWLMADGEEAKVPGVW